MRACLAVLALAATTAQAAAQICVPSEVGIAAIRADPAYLSHHVAAGREVVAAAALFNAAPPETDHPWSAAVLVTFKAGGAIVVGFDGLLCGSIRVPHDLWPAVRRGIVGVEG